MAVQCAYPSKAETRNEPTVEKSNSHECNGRYSIDDGKDVIQLKGPLPWLMVRLQFNTCTLVTLQHLNHLLDITKQLWRLELTLVHK
jgi:hypothetical protein